jgi:isopentenyl diphosphate isomerase/L-lactate dehydrogenase-like FMN-dependent dehydrogenase
MRYDEAVNIEDLRTIAKRRLPRFVFDYVDGGAEDERTLAHNRNAFARLRFLPRTLVDGGVRRGSDIAKAVALGAEGVLLGRAPVYGLAAGGEAGVAHALGILADEFDRTLALTGSPDVAALRRDLIARA